MSERQSQEREIRLRCLEAVARSGTYQSTHSGGPVVAVIEAAAKCAEWVLEGKKK